MLRLASVFHIDIAAFAVLSNHYHLVLHVRRDDALLDSPESIVYRAMQLVAGNEITQRYLDREPLEPWEREQLDLFVDKWRERLYSISSFMKFLNEGISRRANKEDECTGHFWESRFKCQALLDEKALLSAMAYVDLNPVRAAMAITPETSDHTSIQLRITYWKDKANLPRTQSSCVIGHDEDSQPAHLMRFAGNDREAMPAGLPFNLIDYLELIDWSGRAIIEGKRGSIPEQLPPILQRLEMRSGHWLELCTHLESRFKGLVGSVETIKSMMRKFGLKRCPNYRNSRLLFG